MRARAGIVPLRRATSAPGGPARKLVRMLSIQVLPRSVVRTRGHRLGILALACGVLLPALGCGAVTASSNLNDARRELDEAHGLDAEKNAPYEYTRADTYFQKAKKLAGEGMYEQASEYARLSQNASEKALDVARLAKDRQKRKEKFAPKQKDEGKKAPGFTPSGED